MNEKISFKERISITLRAKDTIKEYCPNLMQTIFIQAIVTALQPFATIWFSAQIINELSKGDNLKLVVFYAVVVVLLNYIISIIKGRVDILQSERESQMWSYFDKIFTDKLLSLDVADLENSEIQKQKARARENLFTFGNGLAQFIWTINSTIQAIVNITVSIFMTVNLFASKSENMFLNSPIWILVLIMLILFSGLINAKLFQKNDALFTKWCDTTVVFNRLFKFFGFTICNQSDRAKDVRIYRQDILADKELYRLEKIANTDKIYQFQTSMIEFLASVSVGISNVYCYVFVVLKSFYGAYEVGSVIGYVAVLARFTNGLQQLIFGLTDNAIYTVHLKKLFEFLDIPNKKYQGTLPVEKRYMCNDGDNVYEIEFRNVSFQYPNTSVYALKNLNFKLEIGKKLAVVGKNGSGKTTMIKLLTRLYDPTEGEILLNGINIKKYDYKEYMSIFGVVFQDFHLFAFTLGQNVACSVDYDQEKVRDCLTRVGFGDRLLGMPKGLDTCIYKMFDENGIEISGGEEQKIALARALYKEAPFVILDEPTAALDPLAEYEIYSKFDEIVGNKTAVYISHRLSSCKVCDQIVVFDAGKLVLKGTHEELLADEQSQYFELWQAQAQYYKE